METVVDIAGLTYDQLLTRRVIGGMPLIDRRAALVRGINNIGQGKRISMAELRGVFERLGHLDVRTVLNSGNVAFTVGKRRGNESATVIERALADRCGVSARVLVLRKTKLKAVVRNNPFQSATRDPSRLLVMALRDEKAVARVRQLLSDNWAPEILALSGRIAYLWCADGVADSRLWPAVGRAVGDAGTARNFATMTKLLALVDTK
jgi:uncharacterized protein (DUF1697 family)